STGAQSKFSVSVTGNTSFSDQITASENNVTEAQDAEIHLGNAGGPAITSSTNTFDDVIPGVTMTFSEVSDPDDPNDVTTFT
ncbi:flagellar hook protein, partial [Salmonella enterica subsp. enterica serovar Javiana]|nr:flagellar hook protein [Salmonella enterica subsp. enterica serovar Javiana]